MTTSKSAWIKVAALWAACVGLFGLVLLLLSVIQQEQIRAYDLSTQLARVVAGKDLLQVEDSIQLWYQTSTLVQFAAVGLAVLATAWLGRRVLAAALPLIIAISSLAPAYFGQGTLAPHPIGESDSNVWGSLVLQPTISPVETATWPLYLGIAVQTALLLLPLLAAPRTAAPMPSHDTLVRAAVPAAILALLALALLEPEAGSTLWHVPAIAAALTYLVLFLAEGTRPRGLRILAAIAIPTVLAPVVLESALENPAHGYLAAALVAISSAAVLAYTGVVRMARDHQDGADQETDSAEQRATV